jgi:hypothetical protein
MELCESQDEVNKFIPNGSIRSWRMWLCTGSQAAQWQCFTNTKSTLPGGFEFTNEQNGVQTHLTNSGGLIAFATDPLQISKFRGFICEHSFPVQSEHYHGSISITWNDRSQTP